MRRFFIQTQIVVVSLILLVTFGLMMALLMRFNYRWDFTKGKIYSLAEPTARALQALQGGVLEVLAFYPHDDPARRDFEIFLKEAQLHHPRFKYRFYDPDRVPRLAEELKVKEIYTVVIRYGQHEERIVRPTEERFATALVRLAHPKIHQLCFVTGHGEAPLRGEDRHTLKHFRDILEVYNYNVDEIILIRDHIPGKCDVVVVAGPHRDLDPKEWELLKDSFRKGKGVWFLIDPMDPGKGESFIEFVRSFGVYLGTDVIVDKMSRRVGGDFLVPLVNQYLVKHPITRDFDLPTFFPVARSVAPSTEIRPDLEVVPLAFSSQESWAETDLSALEKGEASFDEKSDLTGPICLAVAVEHKRSEEDGPASREIRSAAKDGRMVVVGDSDFITNAYLDLSGNQALALKMLEWLTKDERTVVIPEKHPEFKPLLLTRHQSITLLVIVLAGFPLCGFVIGSVWILWRNRTG